MLVVAELEYIFALCVLITLLVGQTTNRIYEPVFLQYGCMERPRMTCLSELRLVLLCDATNSVRFSYDFLTNILYILTESRVKPP